MAVGHRQRPNWVLLEAQLHTMGGSGREASVRTAKSDVDSKCQVKSSSVG